MKALILIDIQNGLTQRKLYEKERFIQTVNDAIQQCRDQEDMIIFVQHENKQLIKGSEAWALDDQLERLDSDPVFSKVKGNAFSNADLVQFLERNKVYQVVIGGLVSHGCVKHTCMGGVKQGYDVHLLRYGHSCWNQDAADKISTTHHILQQLGVELIH